MSNCECCLVIGCSSCGCCFVVIPALLTLFYQRNRNIQIVDTIISESEERRRQTQIDYPTIVKHPDGDLSIGFVR